MQLMANQDCSQPESAADTAWNAIRPAFDDMYYFSDAARTVFFHASHCHRIYIVGCLLLNVTASVNPSFTSYSRRLSRNLQCQLAVAAAAAAAAAGFYSVAADGVEESAGKILPEPRDPIYRCFHCNAAVSAENVAGQRSDGDDAAMFWTIHRAVSPACYFVRLRDFIMLSQLAASEQGQQQQQQQLAADIEKFCRALRKLRRDLAELDSLRLAATFGYSPRAVAFCATRHFMRSGGRVPERAGDMIACLHGCQESFEPTVLESIDVSTVLSALRPLETINNSTVVCGKRHKYQ